MKGACLCGAVTVTAPDIPDMNACHCGRCRRWGGGPLLSVHCGSDAVFTGREHITVFPSSEWAERAFCATCGTHLYYRLIPADDFIVPVGLFDEGTPFRFTEQIFIDRKPGSYAFADATATLTEAEVFAKYGAE
ncbi:MAG: GFA family protein [Steroidobacteraceae bacterium]